MKLQSPSEEIIAGYPHLRRSTSVESIVNTLDWLLVALILALLFRAYAVEAFQIPTGSMAETLKGAHWHMRCLRCGHPYDMGGDEGMIGRPECPNCRYRQPPTATGPLANGDRIFVNKCIYQFSSPRRWDVVVFKNPPNPQENYIKRLVGLPEETIEIIDGDLYINGRIARKPRRVQDEMWTCIYRNDYQPMDAEDRFRKEVESRKDIENSFWNSPFVQEPNGLWDLSSEGPSVFVLNAPEEEEQVLNYVPRKADEFSAFYAYNSQDLNSVMPLCPDLMIRFWVEPSGTEGSVGAVLEENGIRYTGRFDFSGSLVLEKSASRGEVIELNRMSIEPGLNHWFEFANVDRRLVLRYGSYRLSRDLEARDSAAGAQGKRRNPAVQLLGRGTMKLRHTGLYRDIYYLSEDARRAGEGDAFALKPDEFFVCGDNSPNSSDSRAWAAIGMGNNGKQYRPGIVPREFLMGKAFFVYWSGAFRPRENMMPILPNFGGLQVIYGGSEEFY